MSKDVIAMGTSAMDQKIHQVILDSYDTEFSIIGIIMNISMIAPTMLHLNVSKLWGKDTMAHK